MFDIVPTLEVNWNTMGGRWGRGIFNAYIMFTFQKKGIPLAPSPFWCLCILFLLIDWTWQFEISAAELTCLDRQVSDNTDVTEVKHSLIWFSFLLCLLPFNGSMDIWLILLMLNHWLFGSCDWAFNSDTN